MSNKINSPNAQITVNGNLNHSELFTIKSRDNKKKRKKQEAIGRAFVVHGHDKELLDEVVELVKAVGMNAVISMDLANQGKTIIEKIEASSNVDCAIVLYTPCDIGAKKGSPLMQQRARQNVVFEHGYLLAKLGRDRVFSVTRGELELPSDLAGLLHISTNDSHWKTKLKKEFSSIFS